MATAKKTGVAYTVPPNTTGSGAVNNRGSAARVGSSSSVLSNVVVSRDQTSIFGSTALDDSYSDKAVSAGTFRYNSQRPVGMRVSSSLAGVANTALRSGAGVPSQTRSINKRESFKVVRTATAIRTNKYNRYTNTFENGFPVSATETPGSDTAATPTRSAPGQLTYKLGQPVPVSNNDYKAKTG
jgi:hypothetical protein